MPLLELALQNSRLIGVSLLILFPLIYIIYQRSLHPLSKYPGPFLASLTDLWQVHQFLTLKQPYELTRLHAKYGPIVRYGPDKISVTSEGAIPLIYQKGGRHLPKTEFYDAYGAAHANVFGMRDEDEHAVRRRHMSHSFSMAYVKEMEVWLDHNIGILKQKILRHAANGKPFNLKTVLHYYIIDTLGELAFSQSFGVQVSEDEAAVPPVVEHSLLAAVTGAWPAMLPYLKRYLPYVPSKRLRALFSGRNACADLASHCVQKRLYDLQDMKDDENAIRQQRKDILTNLILAKHPETGENLTQQELNTEAFGFIIAGTHTTSATTSLLFWHLLHNPEIMAKVVSEVDTSLPDLSSAQSAHSITILESSLPFLRECMKENFRVTPVFTMPLARRVTAPEGIMIDGQHIPQGTSVAVCNHAFHHDPAVWGGDHNVYDPGRWSNPDIAKKSRYLMHFGLGGRQCIGKTVATTNIYKITSSLLKDFEFELADPVERKGVEAGAFVGILPDMVSVGISDLEHPLMVRVKLRASA